MARGPHRVPVLRIDHAGGAVVKQSVLPVQEEQLVGRKADWHGDIVPVVLLENGNIGGVRRRLSRISLRWGATSAKVRDGKMLAAAKRPSA